MSKYELAIAVADEADLKSGHKRKKEGDIVCIRPYPWHWGCKEVDEYLIVIIESDRTLNELERMFQQPYLEGGYNKCEIGQLNLEESSDIAILNSKFYHDPVRYRGGYMEQPVVKGRNRYRISLNNIIDLDLGKTRDKTYVYQPFKKKADIAVKPCINSEDIDCVGLGVDDKSELVLSKETTESLILDKYDGGTINGKL